MRDRFSDEAERVLEEHVRYVVNADRVMKVIWWLSRATLAMATISVLTGWFSTLTMSLGLACVASVAIHWRLTGKAKKLKAEFDALARRDYIRSNTGSLFEPVADEDRLEDVLIDMKGE